MISDLVWLTDRPNPESKAFWKSEYPDMQTVATRKQQMHAEGYEVLDHFSMSPEAWTNYIHPLRERVKELEPEMKSSAALKDFKTELNIYKRFLGDEFGYHFFILRKAA